MASAQVQEISNNDSRLQRALLGLPMLALSGIMANAFAMGEPLPSILQKMLDNSMFDWKDVKAPLLREFYGIKLLDDVFAHITVAFAQLQFFSDERAYWHSLVFLTEFAGMYAILFLESLRPANRRTLFAFPFLLAFPAQLGGIGFLAPLYFYFFFVFTPVEKLTSGNFLLTNCPSCVAVLPTVFLTYLVPHLPSYFHQSLEARNWWNWVWQLFPIWGSVCFFVISNAMAILFRQNTSAPPQTSPLNTVRITVIILALINTGIWWYTMYHSTFSLPELFIPKYFSEKPQEADIALRTILQYDYICTFGAAFLWLALHFRDLEAEGICKLRHGRTLFLVAAIGWAFGPGTLLLLAWLVREEILAAQANDDEQ